MIAYVDESLRRTDQGLYVVAAVVVAADPDDARHAARSVLLPRQKRFHWRDEAEEQRRRMLGQLRRLKASSRVYLCRPVPPRHQARARALCINALVWDLWQDGVSELVFESREEHNDQKDRLTIVRAQKAKRCDPDLAYRFGRPAGEPLLWFPDAIAGATVASITGAGTYLDELGDHVVLVELEP